jgi:hypothetical protein
MVLRFKVHEHKIYKGLHREVLADSGFPSLKKRNFQMPGYRRVLDKKEADIEKALSKEQITYLNNNSVAFYAHQKRKSLAEEKQRGSSVSVMFGKVDKGVLKK